MSEALAEERGLVDVWVLRKEPGHADPIPGLMAAFGIEQATAEALVASLPRSVKRAATHEKAAPMQAALERLGFAVELRPAAPATIPPPRTSGAYRRFPRPKLTPGNLPSLPPPHLEAGPESARFSARADDDTTTLILTLKRETRLAMRRRNQPIWTIVAAAVAVVTAAASLYIAFSG